MPIVDLDPIDPMSPRGPQNGFAVTPGAIDVDYGSDAPAERPAWSDTFSAAFRQDNTVGSWLSSEQAPSHIEPGFDPWGAIKGSKYEQYWDSFVDVRNSRAMDAKKRQIDREIDDRKLLAAAPWWQSLPTQMAAGVLDWPTLLPGGAFVRGVKGGFSVGRSALNVGLASGVASGAQETALQGLQETRPLSESGVNIGASVLLGGLLGAGGASLLSRAEWNRAVRVAEQITGGAELNRGFSAPPIDRSEYLLTKDYRAGLSKPYVADDGSKIVSSRTVPFEGTLPDVGTWRIESSKGVYGHDIEELVRVRIDDLAMPEITDGKLDVIKQGGDLRYADWIKEGRRAPPIEVLQREDGKLSIMDGHRRAIAARLAGQDEIEAWVSYAVPVPGKKAADGKPIMTGLTYELAHPPASGSAGFPVSAGAAANAPASLEQNTIAGKAAGFLASATARLNPALRLQTNISPATREIANQLFENSLYLKKNFEDVASEPAVETLMKEWNSGLASALRATNDAFPEYRKAGGQLKRDQFREAVGRAMRRLDEDENPHVAKVAKEWRAKVFDPLKEAAIKAGLLPEDVTVETAASYFSRMWNRNKLVRLEGLFKDRVVDWVVANHPRWAQQYDRATERRLEPLRREIDDLEMAKLRRAEERRLRDEGGEIEAGEFTEADIRAALRIVEGGAPKPKGVKTLTQWIHDQGGLVDFGGELAHMGINNRTRPGFVRKERQRFGSGAREGGMGFDDAALRAWEAGYFPDHIERPTIPEFLEALADDFSKRRAVVRAGDRDAYRLQEMIDQLEADLSRVGVVAGERPRFSTSEEVKGIVSRVYAALDAEGDKRIADLRRVLAEREALAGQERDARFLGDPKELGRAIADEVFDTLTGKTADGVRPEFIKINARGPLKERTFNIPDALVEEFLESDVEKVGRRYTRMMGADVELAHKFGRPDMQEQLARVREDFKRLRQGVTGEKELAKLDAQEKDAIRDLKGLRDILRGVPMEHPLEGHFGRISRAANMVNYIRSMGEVVLASLMDSIRPAMVHGLGQYMGDVSKLATGMKGIKASVHEAQLAGNVAERVLGSRLATLSEIIDPYASRGPVEAFLENMTNVASKWNGIRLWTDAMKSIASVMTQNRILSGVADFGKIKPKEKAYLAYLGIDQSMAERIAKQFADHGELVDGVRVANTEEWTDHIARRTYRAAINKDVDSIIVQKSVADVPLFSNTPAGRALLQFKTFALASHQKVLLRGLQEDQARFVGGLVAMTALGMFVTWAKSVSGNREDRTQKFLENPGWWIGEGFDRSGIAAVPVELANIFEKASGFNPIKSPMKAFDTGSAISQKIQNRNFAGALAGPSAGMIDDIGTAMAIPKRTLWDGKEATQGQKNAGERLIPLNSYVGIRQMLRYLVNPQQPGQ